jgi:hypothetical protein
MVCAQVPGWVKDASRPMGTDMAYSEGEMQQRWQSYPYPTDSWYSYPSYQHGKPYSGHGLPGSLQYWFSRACGRP